MIKNKILVNLFEFSFMKKNNGKIELLLSKKILLFFLNNDT